MACKITGLTGTERSAVANSWKILNANKTENGMALFMTLFTAYPKTLTYFKNFKTNNLDEIKGTADMRAHAAAVMYAMDSLIDNLEDPECMVGLIRKIAKNHKARDIGKSQFEEFTGLFGDYLDTNLKSKSTLELKSAWNKFLNYMNNQIEKEQAA